MARECTYQAFLSFRGEDTRAGFTSHLYTALNQEGIHTFRDDDGIERGEKIDAELEKAIRQSKISIIVFSKDYASSKWCLNELVNIMKRRTSTGHMVVPIFYGIDPSQVRKQAGSFGESFARHEEEFKDEMHKVDEWKLALKDAADLAGMTFQHRYESQFVQEIVKKVRNKLNIQVLDVSPYLVGLNSRVIYIRKWLEDLSNDVSVTVIYGMGGIGKTTIAKVIFNENSRFFEGASFLSEIRTASTQPNGLVRLQRKLCSDIIKHETNEIHSVDEGRVRIKAATSCKRVLLVLDDVDEVKHLDAILEIREWFMAGSKIIITTRNQSLINGHEGFKMFKVMELDYEESLSLFCLLAFRKSCPDKGYMELSKRAVQHCGGLPLALRILGSSLFGKSVNVWKCTLRKLEEYLHIGIQGVLRISYDSLDDHEQKVFRYIACFFVGKTKDFTIKVLEGCHLYGEAGIQSLIDKCLLSIDLENNLMMHQLLRDMGKEIIREEFPEYPGKRTGVFQKDAYNVLRNHDGTRSIKGFILKARPLITKDENQSSNDKEFQMKSFSRMKNLELVLLENVKPTGSFKNFPKNLRWLVWRGFPLKFVPQEISFDFLVALDLRNSNLEQVWTDTKILRSLKFLNLSHSRFLVRTPDFSTLPNLESIKLKGCTSLVEVDDSIGDLKELIFLNLKGCKILRKLPAKISMSKSLQVLILSGCSKLGQLPELGNMISLVVLHVDGTAINQLSYAAGIMKTLDQLVTKFWLPKLLPWPFERKSLEFMNSSFSFLSPSLVSLSLADCNISDDTIIRNLSILPSLRILELSRNPIRTLPESITTLTKLISLKLEDCTQLQSLPRLPSSLMELIADGCTSLERVENVPNMFRSLLKLIKCQKLVEVGDMFQLIPLKNIDAQVLHGMGLFNFESLESIDVDMMNLLTMTTIKTNPQVLLEGCTTSIFLPGCEVPDQYSNMSMGSSLSLTVPSLNNNLKIKGLNMCVVYRVHQNIVGRTIISGFVGVENVTKGFQQTYMPITIGVPKKNVDILWLSHWKVGSLEFAGGDEVCVSVAMQGGCQVIKFGINLVFEQENDITTQESSLQLATRWNSSIIDMKDKNAFICHTNSWLSLNRFLSIINNKRSCRLLN